MIRSSTRLAEETMPNSPYASNYRPACSGPVLDSCHSELIGIFS
jgi:hypothetical protein